MLKAPVKDGEEERLEALKEYNVLDTTPEINLDDITRIAAFICNVPIALISLIDKNRQWFKSKVGLNADETPRDISFCGHAIYQDDVFIVENALNDERFKDNPLVIGAPNVIFYAGATLKTKSGYNIGTLCAIDHKPRQLNEEQIKTLKALTNYVINHFELRLKTQKLIDSQQQMIHAAKMVSLGEMAGGLAHEINNPMAIISGRSEILTDKINQLDLSDKESLLNDIKIIQNAALRASGVIKSLSQFSQGHENTSTEKNSLLSIINTTLSLSQKKFEHNSIKITINGEDLNFKCKASEISEVILNLLNNSFDAVKNLNEKWIEIKLLQINNIILISVIDSGKGIPDNISHKIFQPFFTTKEVKKGPGLGLSISKGIIESYKGIIYLDRTSPNTRFIIELPIN